MQEIINDQVAAQMEMYGVSQGATATEASGWNPLGSQCEAFQSLDLSDKKAQHQQRLSQMLSTQSRALRSIKPNIDIEDIALQYQNLKREHNLVKEENARMKISLTKMQNQVSSKEDQLMSLNRQMLRLKHDQRISNPI